MKWLKRIFTFCLLLVIGLFLFLRFAYKLSCSDNQMHHWAEEVNSAQLLPEDYTSIVERLDEGYYENGIFSLIINPKKRKNPTSLLLVRMSDHEYLRHGNKRFMNILIIISKTWYLERNVSLKRCHAYVLANTFYFPSQVTELGIFIASQHLFNKPLQDLNTEECLELYLKAKAPTRYDRKRNPDVLSKRIKRLKEKLN